ncbi:ras guanine nucleotide exchange factor R-like, partial [Calliphora vicina]|uniref:ras guanine nucleotide exchange factor R-like n=1 Tax=Calliphora vicina TaxID=7373 RepID=UPI00325A92C8
SVLSYQPHMPQVLSANTVLPDTLKVPIISNMLLPAMAGQCKDNANIKATPIMIQTPATTTATATTPIQTPTLTKHLNATAVTCSNGSSNNNNNANNTVTHNIINSTTATATATTTTDTAHTIVTIPTIATTLVTTPTLSVRCTQVPKSPPRWPLRPGVMVHVSSDTKENLAVNRMTLKPTATLANLTASTVNDSIVSSSTLNNSAATNTTQTTLLNVTRQSSLTLGRIGRQARVQQPNDQQDLPLKVEANEHNSRQQQLSLCQTLPLRGKQAKLTIPAPTHLTVTSSGVQQINLNTSTDRPAEEVNAMELAAANSVNNEAEIVSEDVERNLENPCAVTEASHLQVKLSNFKKVELFFTNIFFKRATKSDGCRDSQRSHVGLLGGKFWKRSEASTQHSGKSPFSTEHRLKGIRSSGSVTYKKCAKTTDSSSSSSNTITTTSATNTCSSSVNNNNNTETDMFNNTGLTTTTAQAQQQTPTTITLQTPQQQQQQQHPLPVSMTSMSPSLNINHPPRAETGERLVAATITHSDRSVTTVIQSIPSTIVSSREVTRNPSQRSLLRGILKAPTPPPRPPPIMRTAVAPLQRSNSHVNSLRNEQVQSKIFGF